MNAWLFCTICGVLAAVGGILTHDLPVIAVGVSWSVLAGIVAASQANARFVRGLIADVASQDTPRPAVPPFAPGVGMQSVIPTDP